MQAPAKERLLIFQAWKVDYFILTPFEFCIGDYFITFIIRAGHHIFKLEYMRRKARCKYQP